MCKGEYDSVLYGWMLDNGDLDNFVGILFSCDNIQIGFNVVCWCDKFYDVLVKKVLLVSDLQVWVKFYEQVQEIFYQQVLWIILVIGKIFYVMCSNVSGYIVSMMGSDFFKVKLN